MCIIYPLKVLGRKNFPKNKSLIVVCNHLSMLDVFQLWVRTPGWRRFMAKGQLSKGILGFFVRGTGTIFVKRDGTDMEVIRKALTLLKKGQSLNIFPEGTRNKVDEELQALEKGVAMLAIKTNATIVPMSILHRQKPFQKNYLSIGKPFDLIEFNGIFNKQNAEQANNKIFDQMQTVRSHLRTTVTQLKTNSQSTNQ